MSTVINLYPSCYNKAHTYLTKAITFFKIGITVNTPMYDA